MAPDAYEAYKIACNVQALVCAPPSHVHVYCHVVVNNSKNPRAVLAVAGAGGRGRHPWLRHDAGSGAHEAQLRPLQG